MRHVFERNRARGTGLFTRRVIAAVATVAMLAGVGCVTASSAAAEDATGALEQQIEQPVLQESGQEDSQPVEQNLMVGEEQPSEQEQPSDQEAYQQVEQETEQETKEETEQWVEQEVEQQSEQQSEQPDEQPVTLSAQPIARANRAQSVAQNETGSQLGAPEKHKRIKKNDNGSYTVNVDVKGAVNSTTVTTTQPIDFTLVLDVSGSMDDPMSKTDRTRRLDALKEAVKAFLDEAANTNTEAGSELVRVGLVKFAGNEKDKIGDDTYRSGGYTYNYSQIVSDLTADMNGLKNKVSKLKAAGATRADNGFNLAAKMMGSARTDAKKVVIFFTDGSPTSSSGFEGKVANKAVEAAKELKDGGATVYSIGVFSGADPSSIQGNENQFMHAVSSNFPKATKYNQRGEGNIKAGYYKSATNASELNAIFDEIEKSETTTSAYTKVTMEDTLSGYVELADSNYKVVAKDASGKVVSLTKNVDYTLTYDASTKKFTVAFLKPLVNNVTYTLEYNVKPTQKAYDEYAANLNAGKDGYDGVKGDANTDLPGNATSSNQPGFHANDSACLAYSADGVDHACGGNPYPHPVIQVVSSTLHIEKQWSGDGDKPESITVDIKQGGNSYKTVTLKSDANGNWSTDVIIPAGAAKTYTVTETEPENHQWKASYQHKVGNGALADGNAVTVPESTASQEATVIITNTLKQTMLTHAIGVQKELKG
ncbi:MAG: VWA domain-containing protein, partial [Bifidobacterium adolescentis]